MRAANPRRQATDLLPDGHLARVLEPSPPPVTDPDWYADDPTDPTEAEGRVVTPIPDEGITWGELAETDPEIAKHAHDHWLDGKRRLEPLPVAFATTREALHQIAFYAVAPKRFRAVGKLGLRYAHRGFGTPYFLEGGVDTQVRVEGSLLVYQRGEEIDSRPVTTVGVAVSFLGLDYEEEWFDDFHDPLRPAGPTASLDVSSPAAEAIGDWFGFATHVLEQARRTPGGEDVSRIQLWPEHFDLAFEMGSAAQGRRASFGASPGDGDHPQPYLYVAAWKEVDRSQPFWNDRSFNGASLSYRQLLEAEDPYARALSFFHQAHRILAG